MSLITATNLSKSFGPVDIFSGVTFAVPKGSRLAVSTNLLAALIELARTVIASLV